MYQSIPTTSSSKGFPLREFRWLWIIWWIVYRPDVGDTHSRACIPEIICFSITIRITFSNLKVCDSYITVKLISMCYLHRTRPPSFCLHSAMFLSSLPLYSYPLLFALWHSFSQNLGSLALGFEDKTRFLHTYNQNRANMFRCKWYLDYSVS